jgi:predicted amidohydrolase
LKDVRVASAQFFPVPCKTRKNLDRMAEMIRQARRRKAGMICFPEMCVHGFDYKRVLRRIYDCSERVPDGPSTERLVALAREHGMYVIAGISEKGDGEFRYNTAVIAGPEGYVGKYRKVHMNSERWLYREADEFPVFDTAFGRIGVSICYDNSFPECARILAVKGAEILFAPNCSGSIHAKSKLSPHVQVRRWFHDKPMKTFPSRAKDNNIFFVFSNIIGGPHRFVGGSAILDPKGEVIASMKRWEEGIVTADLNAGLLRELRAAPTCHLKRRRPSIYGDLTAPVR